jgi:hypothetical protein
MTTTEKPPVYSFARHLFENGIESYHPDKENPLTGKLGTSENLGGCKAFWIQNWKSDQAQIAFNDEKFAHALKDIGASLYTVNRIKTQMKGKKKELVELDDSTVERPRYERINHGLMLYMELNYNPSTAREAYERILEEVPSLEGYIAIASDIVDEVPEVKAIEQLMHRDALGEFSPLKLHATILIAVRSGSQGSSSLWAFKKDWTRESAQQVFKAESADTEGAPL